MSFFSNISEYLILPNWLQFVGWTGAMISTAYTHGPARIFVFISLGIAAAGRLYNFIYP